MADSKASKESTLLLDRSELDAPPPTTLSLRFSYKDDMDTARGGAQDTARLDDVEAAGRSCLHEAAACRLPEGD